MLTSVRTISVLIAITALFAAPVFAQPSAVLPNESPGAMRPSTPQAAATLTAQQLAAVKEAEKGTPAQQELARKIADAMTNKDYGAIKDLIAPSTLKCIGKNQDFLQDQIKRQLDLPMSRQFNLMVTQLPDNLMKPTTYSTYPMPATHLLSMEFDAEDGRSATVNLPVGQEDGNWYEAQPCPTQLGMERFGKMQQTRAQHMEEAKAAMAKVKDPVKSQLLALVGKHDNFGAWTLCMNSMHLDFSTCHGVVALLSGQESD